jgi:hypothetical protein
MSGGLVPVIIATVFYKAISLVFRTIASQVIVLSLILALFVYSSVIVMLVIVKWVTVVFIIAPVLRFKTVTIFFIVS